MRREIREEATARRLAAWGLLAIVCFVVLCLGQLWMGWTQETVVPNDLFAQPVATPEQAAPDKQVCLTFDDGPSCNTEAILEILHQEQVPATFFVTAQEVNLEYYPLLRVAAEQGHQIALHSASHQYSRIYASTTDFWLDIKELRQQLAPYLDLETVNWLRFPGGSTNTISHRYGGSDIMTRLIEEAEQKGYRWIDWNVCAEDATRSHPDADAILRNIQRDAVEHDTCVVLLHDTKATGQTVKALPSVIQWFREGGYAFYTVAQMDALKNKE